jgi:hypothetical protein
MNIVRLGKTRDANIQVEHITVEIKGVRYRLSESVDNKLTINVDGVMSVFPRYSNEVEILGVEK